jgi:hypothetical protein
MFGKLVGYNEPYTSWRHRMFAVRRWMDGLGPIEPMPFSNNPLGSFVLKHLS